MTVTAIMLSYNREPNVGLIIEALEQQTYKLDEIILINNNPKHTFKVNGMTVINSSRNFGCPFRHAVGLLVKSTHCLFLDDDVRPRPGTVENLVKWQEKYPESIVGYYGRKVQLSKRPYHDAPMLSVGGRHNIAILTDIVVGKIHLCRKDKLAQVFSYVQGRDFDHFSCDDIALSLANKMAGHQNYVVPWDDESKVDEIQEFGIGLGHAEDWWEKRDQAVKEMLRRTGGGN